MKIYGEKPLDLIGYFRRDPAEQEKDKWYCRFFRLADSIKMAYLKGIS